MGESLTKTAAPESENENEYFDLIDQKIKNESVISQNQGLNIDGKPKKNWKTSLLHYLDKQSKLGITWCKELYQIIKIYPFVSEKKYIDYFFWQRFEVKTKPKCLNITPHQSLKLLKVESDEINQQQSQSTKSIPSVSRSHLVSEISKKEYENKREKLKEYIGIFKKHLKNKDHPITVCINLFVDIFSREIKLYTEEIEEIKFIEEKKERAKEVSAAITQQLVFYLFKIQKCFSYMYSDVFSKTYFKQEKEEFTNMFTAEFFSHKKLYELIINLYTLEQEEEIYSFCLHTQILNNNFIHPKDVKVNSKFCLDKETIEVQRKFIKQKEIKLNQEEINEMKKIYDNKDYIPYKSSIELLKTIKIHQAPIDKINVLYSVGSDVIENINKVWKPIEKYLPKNFLSVDGDELISIFCYIVIKAQMPELLTHIQFIKNFTTKDTKSSMIGYYYNAFEAGIINARNVEEKNYDIKEDVNIDNSLIDDAFAINSPNNEQQEINRLSVNSSTDGSN